MSSEGAAAGDCSSAPFGKFLPSHPSAQPGSLWWARHGWRCIHEPGRRWSGGRSVWWQPQCLLHKLPATPKKVENHERDLMVVKLNKDNWSLTQNCERILSSLCLQVLGSNDANIHPLNIEKPLKLEDHLTCPSYRWQNPLMIFCLYSWSALSSIRRMVCMVR